MKYNRNVYQALIMITQFGINMLVPIFLCSFAGMFIDYKLGTSVWTVVLFLWVRWLGSPMYSGLPKRFMRRRLQPADEGQIKRIKKCRIPLTGRTD